MNLLHEKMGMTANFSKIKSLFLSLILVMFGSHARASDIYIGDLTISKIRAVGEYYSPAFSNTIEIWFSSPLIFPSGAKCAPNSYRVHVDIKHKHIIASAYLAFATGKKININVDDQLPIRGGGCELSYLDILN